MCVVLASHVFLKKKKTKVARTTQTKQTTLGIKSEGCREKEDAN